MTDLARAADLLGPRVERGVPLAPLSTYRVGGAAALFLEVRSDDDLARCRTAVAQTGIEVLVIGNGSNLLVRDAGFDGLALQLGARFRETAVDGDVVVAGGGAKLPVVARETVQAGLTGFEWAVGVPGTIGGAVRMNAGGHGSDMAAVVSGVRVFDARTGETSTMSPVDCDFGYRHSSIRSTQVVLDATLHLAPAPPEVDGTALLRDIVRWRRAHQPVKKRRGDGEIDDQYRHRDLGPEPIAQPKCENGGEGKNRNGLRKHHHRADEAACHR